MFSRAVNDLFLTRPRWGCAVLTRAQLLLPWVFSYCYRLRTATSRRRVVGHALEKRSGRAARGIPSHPIRPPRRDVVSIVLAIRRTRHRRHDAYRRATTITTTTPTPGRRTRTFRDQPFFDPPSSGSKFSAPSPKDARVYLLKIFDFLSFWQPKTNKY